MRGQIINRDGEILMVVASAEVDRVRMANEDIFEPGADEELFEVALNTSEIKGVIGVRVFTEGDKAVGGVPISIKRGHLNAESEAVLKERTPIGHFYPQLELSEIFLMIEEEDTERSAFPVLEIMIPLFSKDDEEVS